MYKPKNKKVKAASTNKRLRGILIAVIVIYYISYWLVTIYRGFRVKRDDV